MEDYRYRRRVQVVDQGDVAIVHFLEKKILDEGMIQQIGDQLFALVEKDGRKKILLNFGNVEFLSSAALGKLITLHKKVVEAKGRLKLCLIRPELFEVFKITQLNKLFEIHGEEQEALGAF